MSQKCKKLYRIAFRDTTPEVEVCIEIGVNREAKHPVFFVAPLNDQGGTMLTHMRSCQSDMHGNPNGYYPTLDEAKDAIKHQISSQIERMNEALAAVEAVEEPQYG